MAKQDKSETKVRRVSAKSDRPAKTKKSATSKSKTTKKQVAKQEVKPKTSKYAAKISGKKVKKTRKPLPKFLRILFKPFTATGRYFKEAWTELKLVRWPTRAETWKMTGAVLVFSISFATIILLLDMLFTWLFTTILG
ncbi:MAG: preprotein translocase subunit SecE [Candidatus Sacchiramonaceae bacterium]|nr:preprotein translocase subunit SecE [Candidatus Saccharimonadaceae bacterium]